MRNEADPEAQANPEATAEPTAEAEGNFAEILSDYERAHAHKPATGAKQIEGRVISVSAERVFVDIGYKMEGVLPRSAFGNNADDVKPGDLLPVSITGRNEEGYYELSRFRVAQPRDWSALEEAFAQKLAIACTVTSVVKGGLAVDIGVRAFLPASRSGARDAAELEELVGTEISCRIIKLDVTDEDVVVDRRVVIEEQARSEAQGRLAALKEGDTVAGTVRGLTSYGAFVDLGGIDGLLHVSDISWGRVNKPEDVLNKGQQIQVRVLKIDPQSNKISLGLKQLEQEPWEAVPAKYHIGQRIRGRVTRLADFGAFVEMEPGVEGLIHISEMSWAKKVRHPSDLLKQGDMVDAAILAIRTEERRISLGLKQTLSDPWSEVWQRFPVGSQVQGPVTKLMKFGALVEIADGIEGLVHISEIAADRRLNHPGDVLRAGQLVKAQVLAIDPGKRQIKLSMKQLIPTSIDEYLDEHKPDDVVSGRVVEVTPTEAVVELGDGIHASCGVAVAPALGSPVQVPGKSDLSSLMSMLQARWKGNAPAPAAGPEPLRAGQIRNFRIVRLDKQTKRIAVEPA